jgi:hypothetical protein
VPLNIVVIEDVAAVTKKGAKRWNINFSPLAVGKQWFDQQVKSLNLNFYKLKLFFKNHIPDTRYCR